MFCVRICNKNDILCYSCSKKVSSLRMGRIYCQDSRGDLVDYNQPPTEEFKMYTENPSIRYVSSADHWFTLMKAVMNDCWFDKSGIYRSMTIPEIEHMMHKLYYCWLMMGKDMYNWSEEE